ncbi:hypothetical protein HYPSUDRAFT_150880 [Hypholoma sublateritium FD-334 SS-4]|uniref:Uncharacterized protein n=1 Tax=Hypholoma sublateritium (strain FD-334 SS-4) TaxID=945553 RepID=A0A0D2NZY9_HYPSF|nr:hypothetical protein HYPSUDRAFT_150880 [Hypholoma sublateritium FD-334 SS-4]
MLTLGHLLIQNGVKFRTFERLPVIGEKHPVLWEPFQPRSYRQQEYKFTAEDFKAALLHTKYLLWTLPGRAALLSGGIIGRIAREFLLPDDVLDGPSVEATYIRKGFCVKANDGQNEYWDDDLTEQEKAIICGTYIMYTGFGEQTTKISWFPPTQAWEGSSYDSLEWTPRAEDVFQSIFDSARKGEFQPLSANRWRDRLRNFKSARVAFANNRSRATTFLAQEISVGQS